MTYRGTIVVYENGLEEWAGYEQPYLPHRASNLIEDGIYDETDLKRALQRAFLVCMQVHIPIRYHFQRIHVHNGNEYVAEDWALSDFAFYLLLMNGDVSRRDAAFAQAYVIFKAFIHPGYS